MVPGRQEVGGETRVIKCHGDDLVEVLVKDRFGMSVAVVLNSKQVFTVHLWMKLLKKKWLKHVEMISILNREDFDKNIKKADRIVNLLYIKILSKKINALKNKQPLSCAKGKGGAGYYKTTIVLHRILQTKSNRNFWCSL